jgi:hypothetical protein
MVWPPGKNSFQEIGDKLAWITGDGPTDAGHHHPYQGLTRFTYLRI